MKRLILHPELAVRPDNIALPPGAIAAAQREQREKHAGIGLLLGTTVGGLLASQTVNDSCDDFNIPDCERRAKGKMRNEIIGTVSGAIVGALVGWILPVSF
jgi:outer membrane lipoprotein SlyB